VRLYPGIDLAKSVFQVHDSDTSGLVVFRKTLQPDQVLTFFSTRPRCVVAMEAGASAPYWAREIALAGYETRLIPSTYAKPLVQRQKNDMADAKAICKAAQRPTMRLVQGNSAQAQASAAVLRTRDLLLRRRTQLINALGRDFTEFNSSFARVSCLCSCCMPGARYVAYQDAACSAISPLAHRTIGHRR
jgi:transposase